jgi:hypothetical protein
MAYPVSYSIQRPEQYNRLTVLFRIILVLPQYFLLFGFPFTIFTAALGSGSTGVLQLLSYVSFFAVLELLVFIAWFAILFTGRFPQSLLGFCLMVFRWEQNVAAYFLLLAAPYPPFGSGPYPVDLQIQTPEQHNRLTSFFRFILVIPHAVVLFFLGIAALVVTIIAWFAILFTGQYPAGMYDFVVGVARWSARVAAYEFLLVDEYPPFSLSGEEGAALQPEPA